jgi:tetratricopeptide (TPR) repeat protein
MLDTLKDPQDIAERDIRHIFKLATEHHRTGRLGEAEKLYLTVLGSRADFAPALHLLGVLRGQLGNPPAAVELIRRAIAIYPTDPDYHSNLAKFLIETRDETAAIVSSRHAIALAPHLAEPHLNLGTALMAINRWEEAAASFRYVISLKPDYAEAHSNLGAALKAQGQLDAAISSYRQAIALQPEFVDAHWNLGLLHLLKGNFPHGWAGYEWRLKLEENASLFGRYPQPRWIGEDLAGRTILLITEQGFGDAIQFIRYAPLLVQRGGRVVVCTDPPLARLFKRIPGIEEVFLRNDPPPPYDVQCPLLSLPRIFGASLQNIPAEIPYLSADPESIRRWARRFHQNDRRRRIGLVWAGSPTHKCDPARSLSPSSLLSPLSDVKNSRFFSLQKGPAAAQPNLLPANIALTDWTSDLIDFADTAALIASLDLVITVDTAVAHLAGAMGKPVWVMLPFILDWRWLMNRTDSPWYPTMRLFRQRKPGDWTSVIEKVVEELRSAE